MLETQFKKLKNMAEESSYKYNTIVLNRQSTAHFQNRMQQIYNQFDLVDFEKRGYLFRAEIQQYLQKKYQWVNSQILNQIFHTMAWERKDPKSDLIVYRDEFCQQYLKREKQLFYEFNKLDSQRRWFDSLLDIYQSTIHLKPSYYVSVQILKLQLYKVKEDFVNVYIKYQDHDGQIQFDIEENSYDITKPSFELILPAQQNQFFLSYKFNNVKDHEVVYGNTFIQLNLRLKQGKLLQKQYSMNLQIKKNGIVVGHCRAFLSLQTNFGIIKQKLQQKQNRINQNQKRRKGVNLSLPELKEKQYQYVKFLWGIKHVPPQKIIQQDITLIIILRTLLIIGLGGLGIVVHVLGRCQPLSLICVFILLKWRTYVILKVQVFLMTWLIIASILLDIIWLVFSSHHISQINYLNLNSAMFFTYIFLGVKAGFFIYILAFQKPFKNSQQST